MAKISADRFNELKARVKAECQRRAYSGSVSSYGGTTYDYSVVPATGVVIKDEHREKIATPLNAINSDVITKTTGIETIGEADMVAMEAFTTTLETRTQADYQGTDCRSGCTGMCYGCQGTCYNACTSCTGCSGSCGDVCTYGCTYSCQGCSGTCFAACADSCSNGCGGSCGGCANTCSGGCTSCTNACSGVCGAGCGNSCTSCTNGCVGTCSAYCGFGCGGNCGGGNVN